MKASPRRCIRSGTENGGEIRGTAGGCPLGHYGRWAAAAMEIMAVTVITVCAADRQHIYSSPKAIPHPLNLLNPLNLHAQRACPCLPADWYLSPIVSNTACTEILRRRLRMTVPGGKSRNADFKLIAEGDTTTL